MIQIINYDIRITISKIFIKFTTRDEYYKTYN